MQKTFILRSCDFDLSIPKWDTSLDFDASKDELDVNTGDITDSN